MTLRHLLFYFNLLLIAPQGAQAHASEQGFVLLLPTDVYTQAGVAVVALTVLALFAVPERLVRALFAFRSLHIPPLERLKIATSLMSLAALLWVVYLGLNGPRNPLANLMPLTFWTVGWIAVVSLAGILGNLFVWLNPWSGLYHLLGAPKPVIRLPETLGFWPGAGLLIGFSAFLLADIAPDDPTRLAKVVGGYWGVTMVGLVLCGPAWLRQFELGHAVFAAYGALSALGRDGFGGVGWQALRAGHPAGFGIFALLLLAVGSFDGLNETFWWLGQIGVNPLEFPGRSAVILQTLTGLMLSVVLLLIVFGFAVWSGMQLSGHSAGFVMSFQALAVCVLPIALVYHVAHYLPTFLVNIQYVAAAINDPWATGSDLFRWAPIRVTTGFFNQIDTVRVIFLTQAGLVVFGHVWSVLLSHRAALDLFGSGRRAALATLPLSLFMIGYTFLGLWLLAAPKGA